MAYQMKVDGMSEISEMLEKLGDSAQAVASKALYEGAGIMADSIRKGADTIRTAEFHYASNGDTRLPSPEEKEIVQAAAAGIAKFNKNGTEVDTSVGFRNAGYAELNGKMVPIPKIVNAIEAHHNDVEPICIESIIVQIADAISAARPGARRETLDNYIKRLENLEDIAVSFEGVDKAFAIQAGRELRILVNADTVTDDGAKEIAKGIASRIEAELRYPGRIKVTIIREMRAVEYAR